MGLKWDIVEETGSKDNTLESDLTLFEAECKLTYYLNHEHNAFMTVSQEEGENRTL